MSHKKILLDARLPATPCTQEMRERFMKIVEKEGRPIAELQREAIALFLSGFDKKMSENASLLNVQEWVREGQS